MAFRLRPAERVADVSIVVTVLVLAAVTVYPFLYIVSASLSDAGALARQQVVLWPVGLTLDAYRLVFSSQDILLSYYNTIWYTLVGTAISVVLTTAGAYPLSRKGYSLRKPIMVVITITMFFSGGLIPYFLLVNQLGLYNTRWAIVVPGAVSAWNLVMARVFFQSTIPEELTDAARIDGANDVTIFYRIVVPLSKPILAVLALYYGVAHWNDFFGPLIFVSNPRLQPLSLYLRKVLIMAQARGSTTQSAEEMLRAWVNMAVVERVKHATIVVALLPIMLTYPFLQKYFVKGVMIGSLKG